MLRRILMLSLLGLLLGGCTTKPYNPKTASPLCDQIRHQLARDYHENSTSMQVRMTEIDRAKLIKRYHRYGCQ